LFTPQQIGPFAAHGPIWQAPVWPRLLQPLGRNFPRPPATMGDILAYSGLDDPEAMTAMIMAWDRILQDSRPDAVVAEYAPMLQLAARGRVPVLGFGTGFSLPPEHLPAFPSFTGQPAVCPEPQLLSGLNSSLEKTGREPLAALPAIYAAGRNLVASFSELDPYREWRREPVGAPAVSGPVPLSTGEGEELFIYFNGTARRPGAFWQAVADSRLPARVHDPLIGDADAATLERAGIRVARAPVAFPEIAERSRLLLSHGGSGFVSSGMMAGLPQIIIPFDVEKKLIAGALAERGLCLRASFEGLKPEAFAAFLHSAWSDAALRTRAQAAAPGFRERAKVPTEVEAANLIEAML
jgi:rhamnosyltransferase subunit B